MPTGGEMRITSEEGLTIVATTEAGVEVEEALELSMSQMKTMVLVWEEVEVSGKTTERTRLHSAEVAEARGLEEVEAVEVTTFQPQIRRLWPRVTRRPGLGTGRVPTPGVVTTTFPGGLSVRSAAPPNLGRTTPTLHPTCLRYRIL